MTFEKCEISSCLNVSVYEYEYDFKDLGIIIFLLCEEHKDKFEHGWNTSYIDETHKEYHYHLIEDSDSEDRIIECPICGSISLKIPWNNEK